VVASVSAFTVGDVVEDWRAGEVRSALEWAQVRALAADGVSQREIAGRLGINRRTVARLSRTTNDRADWRCADFSSPEARRTKTRQGSRA
jgi:IS30 family transposase